MMDALKDIKTTIPGIMLILIPQLINSHLISDDWGKVIANIVTYATGVTLVGLNTNKGGQANGEKTKLGGDVTAPITGSRVCYGQNAKPEGNRVEDTDELKTGLRPVLQDISIPGPSGQASSAGEGSSNQTGKRLHGGAQRSGKPNASGPVG